ncbi:hypothetical protein CCMA1212_002062 [Trichoderma ghanense]|uniref:Uncharacterized protein n=1 Tax=Trichoderma ghanense TaxID=65468 RepID=A0ABY2HDJ3_9HYPO
MALSPHSFESKRQTPLDAMAKPGTVPRTNGLTGLTYRVPSVSACNDAFLLRFGSTGFRLEDKGTATTTFGGVDLDVEKPVIPPALGVQVDHRERKKSSRECSTFNEQKGHRQNQNPAPSVIQVPTGAHRFLALASSRRQEKLSERLGWRRPRSNTTPWGAMQPASASISSEWLCSAAIQQGKPCELAISVRAAGQALLSKPSSHSPYGVR